MQWVKRGGARAAGQAQALDDEDSSPQCGSFGSHEHSKREDASRRIFADTNFAQICQSTFSVKRKRSIANVKSKKLITVLYRSLSLVQLQTNQKTSLIHSITRRFRALPILFPQIDRKYPSLCVKVPRCLAILGPGSVNTVGGRFYLPEIP